MAVLTGRTQIFAGDTSVIDTSLAHPLGTRAFDAAGNEYIYLTGVASTAAGDFVTFDEAHLTIRTVADANGRVGMAMAAIVASRYGWYLIYGTSTIANVVTNATIDNVLYLTSTAGRLDSTDVAGDLVVGIMNRATAASNVSTVELNYPFCHDEAIN